MVSALKVFLAFLCFPFFFLLRKKGGGGAMPPRPPGAPVSPALPLIRGKGSSTMVHGTRLCVKKDTAEVIRNFGVSKGNINNNVNLKQ